MIKTFLTAAIFVTSLLSVSLLIQPVFRQEASAHKDDRDVDLYVASYASSEILRYDGDSGGFVDEFVESGSGGLNWPGGLVFGPGGDLYLANVVTDEVLQFDGDTGEFIDVFVTARSGG
jgi:hypothetical protein